MHVELEAKYGWHLIGQVCRQDGWMWDEGK